MTAVHSGYAMTRAPDNIEQAAERAEGWLDLPEGRLLYALARTCSKMGPIVEIGSWRGKSTIWLAGGSQDGACAPVHAIDPHTGSAEHHEGTERVWTFEEFQRNIRDAELEYLVVPHVATSIEAAPQVHVPVACVFVDGAHDYESVRQDFDAWFPKLCHGGIMAFHDTIGWDGPRRVVQESLVKSNNFRKLRFVHSIMYAERTASAGFADRVHSSYVLALKSLYELLYGIGPPRRVRHSLIKFFSALH